MNDPYAIERRRVRIAELAAIGQVLAAVPRDSQLAQVCADRALATVRWFESEDARQEAERAELEAERA